MTPIAICLKYFAYYAMCAFLQSNTPLLLLAAACVYFLANTIPVAVVVAWSEGHPLRDI